MQQDIDSSACAKKFETPMLASAVAHVQAAARMEMSRSGIAWGFLALITSGHIALTAPLIQLSRSVVGATRTTISSDDGFELVLATALANVVVCWVLFVLGARHVVRYFIEQPHERSVSPPRFPHRLITINTLIDTAMEHGSPELAEAYFKQAILANWLDVHDSLFRLNSARFSSMRKSAILLVTAILLSVLLWGLVSSLT